MVTESRYRPERIPPNVTHHPAHIDLLVGLVAQDAQRVAGIVGSFDAVDLASFVAFARHNQIAGFLHTLHTLHTQIARQESGGPLLAEMKSRLQRRYTLESRKRRLLQAELLRLIDAFQVRGVECIVIKGPELALRYYGSGDARLYWDLDLLVRQEAVDESRRLLNDLGFERRSPMLFGERISLSVAHALDYGKGEVGLDLHWKLSNHPSFHIDYARLWDRRQPWVFDGRTCNVLSHDYALTLNLLSSFKDIERGAFRLRSFVDLWMMLAVIDAEFDWDRFFAERREENVQVICAGVLGLFQLVFETGAHFPRLSRVLERQQGARAATTRPQARQLIEPTFLGPARRLWASRMYQISRTRHLAWWVLSLPVRLNVHKPGKMKRLTQSMRTWLQSPR